MPSCITGCALNGFLIITSLHMPQVEVGPSSFQKIKLLGRGDVGKVFLVREKKSGKLFAMKGVSAYVTEAEIRD